MHPFACLLVCLLMLYWLLYVTALHASLPNTHDGSIVHAQPNQDCDLVPLPHPNSMFSRTREYVGRPLRVKPFLLHVHLGKKQWLGQPLPPKRQPPGATVGYVNAPHSPLQAAHCSSQARAAGAVAVAVAVDVAVAGLLS